MCIPRRALLGTAEGGVHWEKEGGWEGDKREWWSSVCIPRRAVLGTTKRGVSSGKGRVAGTVTGSQKGSSGNGEGDRFPEGRFWEWWGSVCIPRRALLGMTEGGVPLSKT